MSQLSQPAQSEGERVVACLCMITGGFLSAYLVGAICNIVSSLDTESIKYVYTSHDNVSPGLDAASAESIEYVHIA